MTQVNELQSFTDLEEVWNSLLERNILGKNIFSTWDWLSTWWKYFGQGKKPCILKIEDQGEILGLAPLMLSEYNAPGLGRIKKIEMISSRDSDYSNFIITKSSQVVFNSVVDYLKNNIAEWDWIELKEIMLSSDKPDLMKLTNSIGNLNLATKIKECNKCPFIRLPKSVDQLEIAKSTKWKTFRRYLKKLQSNFRVDLKRYNELNLSSKEAMQIFAKLHTTRWLSIGSNGLLNGNDPFWRFQMEIADKFADKGWLGLYFLMADEEPVSALYAFEYGDRVYSYLSGLDPEYAKYSVGNLLTMLLLERLIANRFSEYDMLRGNEPYKFAWTSTYRTNFEMRLVRTNLLSRYYNWVTSNQFMVNLTNLLTHNN